MNSYLAVSSGLCLLTYYHVSCRAFIPFVLPEDTEDCRGLYGIIPGWSGSCDIQTASGRHEPDG
jgi:hypothetical protein